MRLLLMLFVAVWLFGFELQKEIAIEGRYYFTPALGSDEVAAFGYISKVRPTKEEIEKERAFLKKLIEEGVRREYGSWEEYERTIKKAAKEATEGAPAWQKVLMPPTLVEEAAPLLMRGLVETAIAHPELSTEPLGSVGRCGVVLLDEKGDYRTIPLGMNMPVVWLSFSPDGRYLAVLSDASVEGADKRLRVAGRIDVIDVAKRRPVQSYLFANAVDQIDFSPDGRYLAFMVQDPKKWSKRALRFIDTATWRVTEKIVPFETLIISGSEPEGKNYRRPYFRFTKDGDLCLRMRDRSIECRRFADGRRFFATKGGGGYFDLSSRRPRLVDEMGREYDYEEGRLLYTYPRFDKKWPWWQVRYLHDGKRIVAVDLLHQLRLLEEGREIARFDRLSSLRGPKVIFLDPLDRYVYGFATDESQKYVSYKGTLHREKRRLRAYRVPDMQPVFDVGFDKGSAVDGAATKNRLFVSGFDTIRIYSLN